MTVSGISFGRPGTGPATSQVVVPDVVGATESVARQTLTDRGLRTTTSTVEDTGTAGTVFSQDPVARTPRPRGSVVRLLIISGPSTPPPNIGKRLDELKVAVDQVGTAVQAVETEAKAAQRQKEIIDKLDAIDGKLSGATGKSETTGTARTK
jgi:beta-lactam-binding protein with PASTA domain